MADWSGLYLRQDLGASTAVAALAYSFFTAGMTVDRLVGDAINARIGAVALLRGGALLTGIPSCALLLVGQPRPRWIGLFLVGLGVANGVPLMFSAAGRQPDTPPGPGIAAVSSMGSLGFLAGPARVRLHRRRQLAPVVALPADPRRRRRLRPRPPRRGRARGRPCRPTPTPPGAMTSFAAVISDLDGVLVDSMAATSRAWTAWGARHGLDGAAIRPPTTASPPPRSSPSSSPPEADGGGGRRARAARDRRHRRRRRAPGGRRRARAARGRDRHLVRGAARPRPDRRRRPAGARRARHLRPGRAGEAGARLLPARGRAPRPRPADCLVLEDAPAGVAAGRAAGCTVWAVTTTHPAADLAAADRVAAGGCPRRSLARAAGVPSSS